MQNAILLNMPTQRWPILVSNTFYAVALIAVVGIGVGIGRGLVRRAQVRAEVNALQQDLATYRSKQTEFDDLIKYLSTAEFREREARLRLGLKRPGEHVVVVPGLAGEDSTSATQADLASEPNAEANWKKWLSFFLQK